MYKMTYNCVFLVARKPKPATGADIRAHSQPSTQTLAKGGSSSSSSSGGVGSQSVLQMAEPPVHTAVADSTMTLQTQSVAGIPTQS